MGKKANVCERVGARACDLEFRLRERVSRSVWGQPKDATASTQMAAQAITGHLKTLVVEKRRMRRPRAPRASNDRYSSSSSQVILRMGELVAHAAEKGDLATNLTFCDEISLISCS